MDESPNAFTNISHVFAAVNPASQQNFIVAYYSKFFEYRTYDIAKRSYTAAYKRIDFKLGM